MLIAGPTASGKSALAVTLAERLGGTIINADSMQVYRELRVLTARPTPAEEARVPHLLYGVRAATEPGDVAWWRGAAFAAMEAARVAGRLPILCGGTGLYLSALVQGLAAIPVPDPAARAEARAMLADLGPAALHVRLSIVDPLTAAQLCPTDGQRLARAWEVWRTSGRGLTSWQAKSRQTEPAWRFVAILLDPPRAALRDAIAARFQAMLDAGALEEVRALLSLRLDRSLPLMRAQGVRELASHLRGDIALEEAAGRAILSTGHYMKRQVTWFRHHRLADPARTHRLPVLPASGAFETEAAISFASAIL